MTGFRNDIAVKCGVNAAVIAEFLWDHLKDDGDGDGVLERHGRCWYRCSARMMTGEFPYLSIHMAKDAVNVLARKGYIRKGCFNDNRFDHTNWYAFTDYGKKMMEAWW